MTAIVTPKQRLNNAKAFLDRFSGSPVDNMLYTFIAKSDPWNTDLTSEIDLASEIPIGGTWEQSQVYNEMIAMKRVEPENMVLCVPTNRWISGMEYQAYDDHYRVELTEEGCSSSASIFETNFYVVTTLYRVYKCLVQGSGNSTIEPTHTTTEPKKYADGYVWHYMYTISTDDAVKFYNNYFLPVRERETLDPNQGTIEGGIFRIVVIDGGSGYVDGTTTVTIEGNGTGCTATATVVGDIITAIEVDDGPSSTLVHGYGYDYAKVVIEGDGTGALARCVMSPMYGGHGANLPEELGAYNVQVAVDVEGSESGDFMILNDYRRLGLIENPALNGSSPLIPATNVTLNCLKKMNVSSVLNGPFAQNNIISDEVTGAIAYCDYYDSTESIIYYHQNDKTGYGAFGVGNVISNQDITSATLDSLEESEYEPYSGDIIFLEDRDAIYRTSATREEIRVVVQF